MTDTIKPTGASPLTRGKQAGDLEGQSCERRIPAHAGKTEAQLRVALVRGAHPRSRGENINLLGGAGAAAGASPLTRGKRF